MPFVPIPGQEKLVAAIARHATPIMGEEVKPHGVPIYTDARLYSTAGIPTVLYGAGPHTLLEANGHRADEKLKLDDLYKATRVVALALADLLRPRAEAMPCAIARTLVTRLAAPRARERRTPQAQRCTASSSPAGSVTSIATSGQLRRDRRD